MRSVRGVGSAVAVVFIIMIIIAAINAYLVTTLPQQMALIEFQHQILVKNEFQQLQSDVLLEASNPSAQTSIVTPIQLGSQGNPPFGTAASSTMVADSFPADRASVTSGQTVLGGIFDQLNNRYFPINTIVYQYGAVLEGASGNSSIMLSPPQANVYSVTGGLALNLTMVQLVTQNFTVQTGTGISGISTHLLSVFTYPSVSVSNPVQWYNVTTPYPGAWYGFFNGPSFKSVLVSPPFINSCKTLSGVQVCTVRVPMHLAALTITEVVASLSLASQTTSNG
jgi:hypothetical protein